MQDATGSDDLQSLLYKRELDELVFGMMHAMDGGDWVRYRRGIADDAEFDFTDHRIATGDAAEVLKGGDHIVQVVKSVLSGFDATQHHVTNMTHKLDGQSARTDCYVYAEHFLNNDRGDRSVSVGSRYEIITHRTDEGWKATRWRLVVSWFRGNAMLYQLAGEVAQRRASAEQGGGVSAAEGSVAKTCL